MKIEKRIGAALTASALALGLFTAPLESVPLSLGAAVSAEEQIVSAYISADTSSLPDSRELEQMYIDSLFYGGGFSFYKDYGRTHLTGQALDIYETLRTEIEKIATGDRTSTTINITATNGKTLSDDISAAVDCLMVDLPASLYWYDKTKGIPASSGTLDNFPISFTVAGAYASGTYEVNPDKITAAKAAAANAQAIAEKYAGKTDEEKVLAFRDEICKLTEYNYDALADGTPYGDPWQLVSVFDNDDTTNVVCEGYSKAFQYLCDLSGIECYTVTGTMAGGTGAGPHMWNIVVLDKQSYLVDITNCDGEEDADTVSVGYPDKLLLKGADTSSGEGCIFTNTNPNMTYTYDKETLELYSSANILTVSTEDYTTSVHEHEWATEWSSDETGHWQICEKCGDKSEKEDHNMAEVADTAKEPACAEAGKEADMKCSVCGHEETGAEIPATGEHTPGEPERINEVAATCYQEGSYDEVVKCTVCRSELSKESKIIEKTDHTPGEPTEENTVAPTCTKNGSYDLVTKCTAEKCGEVITTEHVIVPAEGHEFGALIPGETTHYQECAKCHDKVGEEPHTEDIGTVTVRPTETDNGVRTYKCSVCGKELRTEPVPVLGENHEHSYTIKNSDASSHWNECVCGEADETTRAPHTNDTKEEIALEAVCNVDGLKYVITYCTDCDREISRYPEVIPKTGIHNAGEDYDCDSADHWQTCTVCGAAMNKAPHEAGPAATETTPQTCIVCGYEMSPVLSHTHTYADAWTSDDSFHWHAATCQHTDEVKDKAVHAWNSGVITTEPTETAKGVKTFTCTVCSATKTEPVSELAHTHTPSDTWRSDITGHWHVCGSCGEKLNFAAHNTVSEVTALPTATVTGTRRYYCSICRYVIRQEVIPATGTDIQPSNPVTAPVFPIWLNGSTASAEPMLDNGSGKSGWKSIASNIKKASSGDTVYVNMNGTTKLSKTALKELIGKNVDLVLEMDGDITWTINGETVTKTSDVNMAAKFNTNNIPNKITEKLSENGKVVQVSLSHSGSFGFDAVMTVYLGTTYNGKYANLMYYNPASGAAEFMDCSLIKNGNASLDFTHASEYAIVISDEPMGAYEDVSAAAGAFENDINISPAAYVSIIAAIAAAMMIFKKRTSKSK